MFTIYKIYHKILFCIIGLRLGRRVIVLRDDKKPVIGFITAVTFNRVQIFTYDINIRINTLHDQLTWVDYSFVSNISFTEYNKKFIFVR